MKKVLLTVLILAIIAVPVMLTACSNVSQRDLLTTSYVCSDDGYEYFAYDVYHKDGETKTLVGEMTMKFEPQKAKDVVLPCAEEASGSKAFAAFTGTLLSVDVTFTNGDSVLSRVIYGSNGTPTYSYKKTVIGGVTKEMQVSYEGKYLYAKRFEDGKEVASLRHKAAGCYDNESLYALVRASSVNNSSYSFGYTCVNPLTMNADGMSISRAGAMDQTIDILTPTDYTLPEGKEKFTTPTYVFRIQTDNQYASSYSMEITQKSQTVKNDKIDIKNVKKIITSITEGDYSYVLKDVKIV